MKRVLLLALAGALSSVSVGAAVPFQAAIDPSNFVSSVTNPWMPLVPGTTYVYVGRSDSTILKDVMHVTHNTTKILGVTCVVVEDNVYEDGVLAEHTFDWYAQDKQGNVWYFGENTKELDEEGHVTSTEGTWKAGVDGARPGIIMEAHPRLGDTYQQEFYKGVAEDYARVWSLDGAIHTPYGFFDDLLVTKEWTPLEPGVVEFKGFAKGIGFVYSEMTQGGHETFTLARILHDSP